MEYLNTVNDNIRIFLPDMFFNTSHSQTNGNEMVVIKHEIGSQITVKQFLLVSEVMNTTIRKTLNGRNLTMTLSTLNHCN
jgi:hypothetical protein